MLDMSVDPMPLSDMPTCTMQLYQTCVLGSFIQIHVFVKARNLVCYKATSMPTGKVWLPRACKSYQLPA